MLIKISDIFYIWVANSDLVQTLRWYSKTNLGEIGAVILCGATVSGTTDHHNSGTFASQDSEDPFNSKFPACFPNFIKFLF